MSPEQCKAARAVIGWTVEQAANQSQVNKSTVIAFENKVNSPQKKTLQRLQQAYESVGVLFTSDGLSITWKSDTAATGEAAAHGAK